MMRKDDRSQSASNRSFGAFLDAVQERPSEKTAPVQSARTDLLRQLQNGPEPVSRLLKGTGLGIVEFAEGLKRLKEADLVELRPSPDGDEIVALTPIGRTLISAASLDI